MNTIREDIFPVTTHYCLKHYPFRLNHSVDSAEGTPPLLCRLWIHPRTVDFLPNKHFFAKPVLLVPVPAPLPVRTHIGSWGRKDSLFLTQYKITKGRKEKGGKGNKE